MILVSGSLEIHSVPLGPRKINKMSRIKKSCFMETALKHLVTNIWKCLSVKNSVLDLKGQASFSKCGKFGLKKVTFSPTEFIIHTSFGLSIISSLSWSSCWVKLKAQIHSEGYALIHTQESQSSKLLFPLQNGFFFWHHWCHKGKI